jgi:hypothetical protein
MGWNIRNIQVLWNKDQEVDKEALIICYTKGKYQFEFNNKLLHNKANKITAREVQTERKMMLFETPIARNVFIQKEAEYHQF